MTRFVRNQLVVFSILTVTAFALIVFSYVRVPSLLGFGRITLTAELPVTGGLYPNANVTYRGYTVGRVTDILLVPGGVEAVMEIDEQYAPEVDSRAEVHSVSAIGEQYIDFVPVSGKGPRYADGDTVPRAKTSVPPSIASVLDSTNSLLTAVKPGSLQTVLEEGGQAFRNLGPDLGRLLDNTRLLVEEAQQNYEPTEGLIRDAEPFLDSQLASGPAARSWTSDLRAFTAQLRESDTTIRSLLRTGPPAATQATDLLSQLSPVTPRLLATTDTLARLARDYNAPIEQVLVVYPMFAAAGQTLVPDNRLGAFNFNLSTTVNQPNCSYGWVPPGKPGGPRSSNELGDLPLPPNSYCKIPQDNPLQARSARQLPCFEPGSPPGRRAALIQECRGSGYDPEGTGPDIANVPGPGVTVPDGAGEAMVSPLGAFGAPDTPAPASEEMTWQGLMLAPTGA